MKQKSQHHSSKIVVGIVAIFVMWAKTSFAEPTIPQEIQDAITQNGTAPIIVELDVPWTPEGLLPNSAAVATQRAQIADTQTQFVETLNQDLADDAIIDDAATSDGTPTIPAETAFKTVPYLVMVVNSLTLGYVQQNTLTSRMALDVVDEPSLQQSLPLIGVDKAWERDYSGQGQCIAVVDTGVDKTHSIFSSSDKVIAEACFSKTLCPNRKTTQRRGGGSLWL
jgi:subtilisin family serine protease